MLLKKKGQVSVMRKGIFTLVILVVMSVVAQAGTIATPHVAGSMQGWAPGDDAMTETALGSDIWVASFTGLVANERYEFKITDGTWDNSVPGANSWCFADGSGNITITYDGNTYEDGWVIETDRIGVNVDAGSWSLVGDFNDWNNADPTQEMTSMGGGIYAITQVFEAGAYNLKPTYTGTWDAIGPNGRSIDAANYNLSLPTRSEVTVYVDALAGTMKVVSLSLLPYDPNPENGAVVGTDSVTALSWSGPDPNHPSETITCDVYWLDAGVTQLTKDPNMGPIVTDPGVVQIADDIPTGTFDLNDALVSVLPLQDDHYYYWAVHPNDPNAPGLPVTVKGDTWYFYTGDALPIPGKPVDQYMWLAQDDFAIGGIGDTNPNVRYFEVTATYTDDGKSAIVDANLENLNWGWDPEMGERGITEVSDVHTPGVGGGTVTAIYKTEYNAADPNYSTDLPGYWQIRLEVTDGSGTAYGDAGIHRIFETCGEAAYADPEDLYDGYYDTNGDCIVNISDFSDFADAWLKKGEKYE